MIHSRLIAFDDQQLKQLLRTSKAELQRLNGIIEESRAQLADLERRRNEALRMQDSLESVIEIANRWMPRVANDDR